jgi:electron transfer flavoprotein alpha subunit
METEIWIWAEHDNGEIRESSLEMLGEARRLASKLKGKVGAVLLGGDIAGLAKDLIAYGADRVYMFNDPRLQDYSIDLYLQVFSSLREQREPLAILIAASRNGEGLAPRLAARLQMELAANTVTLAVQPDNSLKISRSTHLDKAHAVLVFPANRPLVITMRPGSVGLDRPDRMRKGEVLPCELREVAVSRTSVQGRLKADPKVVALDEADRIVAAGVGFRNQAEIELLWQLSEAIGAAVGGSKPVVDAGWLPHSRLIGQSSGRRLSPRLFVGVGVSGTSHFVEGMKDARLIVAINTDKGAPLMKLADLAVVGDLYQVLPELTQLLKARQEGTASS